MLLNGNFRLGEEGFTVCRVVEDIGLETKSDTSSLKAEINSTPEIMSLPADDSWEEDACAADLLEEKRPMFALASDVVFGSGCHWDSDILPWRLEPVCLADLEAFNLEADVLETREPEKDQFPGTSGRKALVMDRYASLGSEGTWSSAEFSDYSIPGLTEGSSRCSENTIPPDQLFSYEPPGSCWEFLPSMCEPLFNAPGLDPLDDLELSKDSYIMEPLRSTGSLQPISSTDFEQLSINSGILQQSGLSHIDETDSDTESVWMSDYSEGIPVLEEAHHFFKIKTEAVKNAFRAFKDWPLHRHAYKQSSPQNPNNGAGSEHGNSSTPSQCMAASGRSNNSVEKRRRKRSTNGLPDDDGNDNEDNKHPEKRPRLTKKSVKHNLCLACPFAKKDSITYRNCYSYVLRRTQDVKQHLSRHHQLPIYCPRCKSKFNTENERDHHATTVLCEVRTYVSYEGVTREQKEQLTQRVSSRMTLEDQWYTIFEVLFPGHVPRPSSPYIHSDLSIDLEAFIDMMAMQGPAIILGSLQAHNIQVSSIDNEEHDLSILLRVVIAEGLQEISRRWISTMNPNGFQSQSNEDAIAFDGSQANHSSELSGTSSETLVESRTNTRIQEINLSPLHEEGPTRAQPVVSNHGNSIQSAGVAFRPLSGLNSSYVNSSISNVTNPNHSLHPPAEDDYRELSIMSNRAEARDIDHILSGVNAPLDNDGPTLFSIDEMMGKGYDELLAPIDEGESSLWE